MVLGWTVVMLLEVCTGPEDVEGAWIGVSVGDAANSLRVPVPMLEPTVMIEVLGGPWEGFCGMFMLKLSVAIVEMLDVPAMSKICFC